MHHIKPLITKSDGKKRNGRGFSLEEIKNAGVTKVDARKMSLPVDCRRKTAHEENVEALKQHINKAKTELKPKSELAPKSPEKAKKEKPKK